MDIASRCHCGNISLTFHWPEAGPTIPVRACSCSFCAKHAGVHTSHPQGRVDVRIADPALVERYRFGTGTADFHICKTCGAAPVVTSTIAGKLYAVVNVNCFEGIDRSKLVAAVSDFEDETMEDRLDRRRRNWIPDVTFSPQDAAFE